MGNRFDWVSDIPEGMDLSWLYDALDSATPLSGGQVDEEVADEGALAATGEKKYYGRPVDRIPAFLSRLGELWQKHWPDWRFGQLMCNLNRYYQVTSNAYDFFHLEEDAFEALLEEYAQQGNRG